MHSYCIACEQRYIYRDGDEDCTKFVCSWCISTSPEKMMNKWVRLRFKILNRDGFTCKYCGKSPMNKTDMRLHIDHIKPQSEYGTNAETNLITACNECNFGKLDFELTDKAKEKVDEYLEEANKRLSEPCKGLEVVRNDKMGDSKVVVRVMANNQYVGTGSLFPDTGKNGVTTRTDKTKK